MPHCRTTVQQSTFVLILDENLQRLSKLEELNLVTCGLIIKTDNNAF